MVFSFKINMKLLFILLISLTRAICEPIFTVDLASITNTPELMRTNFSRRIMTGHEITDTRPYMVYLRAATEKQQPKDPNWLCGGAIIHERYVLTSAACIEDVQHFYVISGTHRWIPHNQENDCIKHGAKKAVWKCVPKIYVFDGEEFDNIRWMKNDIAVVRVEDDFNFQRRVRGCDYVPQKIAYNNKSRSFEKPRTEGSIAGWGSSDKFVDTINPVDTDTRSNSNSRILRETIVKIMSKKNCKRRWPERYHYIIDSSMICSKDVNDNDENVCTENEVNCKELVYSEEDTADYEEEEMPGRRSLKVLDPKELRVHTARHVETRRAGGNADHGTSPGGFCENDHGGPLVTGHGMTSMVIGVISSCQVRDITNKCYGPFLYTSVYRHRHLISCAIDKNMGIETSCRRYLKATRTQIAETTFNWLKHPDGPAKSDRKDRTTSMEQGLNDTEDPFQLKNLFAALNSSKIKKILL